ncbi:MAG: ABC transporter substrate-binding protein [Amaricoccus sp.]
MQRLALLFCLVPALALAGPPERVVSINLCTDQLAMLLADPGQLVSVTSVARDPVASALAARATDYPANNGQAEAVLGFAPDLVLAGEWTAPATLAMLRRLGVRVETFPLENDFADIRANLTRMGDLLGVPDRAAGLIAAMDATLAGPAPAGPRPGAILYYANGYTSGGGTLADAVLKAAGLRNLAAEQGLVGLAPLPLERLVLDPPDLLILGQSYPSPALAQRLLDHPALRRLGAERAQVADNLWTCGTPLAAQAVAELRAEGR